MTWALAIVCGLASIPAGMRWLRVAQREHYLTSSATRFAWRWWSSGPANITVAAVSLIGVVGTLWSPWPGFLVALAQIGPLGMSLQGRTSRLSWTSRMRRLAGVSAALVVAVYVIGGLLGLSFVLVAGLFLLPVLIDAALLVLTPVESRLGEGWVEKAAVRLGSSGATVVAITGSFGKTTTKAYVAQLLSGSRRVVASPASFNNRMGLARAVNEQLVPGTEVFLAEMGTYGEGEIAALCRWIRPRVAAIVSVGPVHLERFKTLERIVAAKAEILDGADVGVIAIDHEMLARLAELRSSSQQIITAGTGASRARVVVTAGSLVVDGLAVAPVREGTLEVNLAVAVGICLGLGLSIDEIVPGLDRLTGVEHRQTVLGTERGVTIIDDTYNSNPAGAASALGALARVPAVGRKVVVTPGMIELGSLQRSENMAFARRASIEVDHLVIVGRTNRAALLAGAAEGHAPVTVVASREEAVDWVRENLGADDAVLYENDLPDHYP